MTTNAQLKKWRNEWIKEEGGNLVTTDDEKVSKLLLFIAQKSAEAERKELEPHMESSHRRCQEHPTNRLYYCDQCIKTSIASERQRVATEFYQFIKNKQKKLKKDELEDMWWYCHEEILDWIKKKWKV